MAQKNNSNSSAKAIGIGAGVVAAAAVGAYLLYGKDGAKNRKKVKGWALKAKGEIVERLEQLQDVSEEAYHAAVDEVTSRYEGLKNVDPKELAALVADARRYWKSMKKAPKRGKSAGARKSSTASKSKQSARK